jgi:Tfp pilus assembly protein PilX
MSRRDNEAGFTMIAVVLGITLVMALSLVAVAAVSGDLHLTRNDLDRKQAFEAAKAGVTDYLFHLQKETDYWTHCTEAKPETNAINQVGSTAKRRKVPGNPGTAEYAIELLPAEGQTQYTQCSTTNPGPSMLEPSGLLKGTFRIRSTGFSGSSTVSITATFKPATFLDYVYYTQRETLDPVTYGFPNPSAELEGANLQCSKPLQEKDALGNPLPLSKAGRNSAPIPNVKNGNGEETTYCVVISFANADSINGPMHTNDSFVIRGSPTLGRSAADPLEVSGPAKGWFSAKEVPNSGSNETGNSTNFKGTFTANAPLINPPPSNSALRTIAGLKFKGQVRICLSGNTMSVSHGATCTASDPSGYSGEIPGNGVVYVEGEACPGIYSPFNATYPAESTCGNAYVSGLNGATYSGQLTIATENDIIINGNLIHTGEGVLGLVANNFVRMYHPFPNETKRGECNNGNNGSGSIENLQIDAAILAIEHSFIVDHYDCGSALGTLTVNGAIAQKYRGPVGTGNTSASTGYVKNYKYDDRLRYLQPPSFIEPAESDWVIGRETIS